MLAPSCFSHKMCSFALFTLLSCLYLFLQPFPAVDAAQDGILGRFDFSANPVLSVDVPVKVCLAGETKALDHQAVLKTLRSIRTLKPLKIASEDSRIRLTYNFSVAVGDDCGISSNILLTLRKQNSKETRNHLILHKGTVESEVRLREGEGAGNPGRVAGSILAAADSWQSSDIVKPLFFSTFEDDGVEISIIGLEVRSGSDPLAGLDIPFLKEQIADWLGTSQNQTIVKATTRQLSEHPELYRIILESKRQGDSSRPDNTVMDAHTFLKGVSSASDALLRAGSAAKLMRRRRREVEVFVICAETARDVFHNSMRLYTVEDNVAVLNPEEQTSNLNALILFGLAQVLAGTPSGLIFEQLDPVSVASLASRALRNVVLYDIYKTISVANDALTFRATAEKASILQFTDSLKATIRAVEGNEWKHARSIIKGTLREDLRSIVKISHSEKKKCCVKKLVYSGSVLTPRSKRRNFFLYLYLFVSLALIASVAGLAFFFKGNPRFAKANILFGRRHLE